MPRLRTTLEFRRGDELVAHVVVPRESVWFDGHFPGLPLLPGVAMLVLVEDALLAFWEDGALATVEATAYRRVRFRQRVDPGANLRLHIRRMEQASSRDRLRFSVEQHGTAVCTGECTVVVRERRDAPLSGGPGARRWAALDWNGAGRFCSDGTTLAEVAQLAAGLRQLGAAGPVPSVCVASADRLHVVAAMVAALSGAIEVVFPSTLTAEAVAATHRARAFSHWLGPADWTSALSVIPAQRSLAEDSRANDRSFALADVDLARVFLQTGGSTGEPQLWPKTARNLLDEVAAQAQGLRIGPDDHILSTVPPHHIYGLLFSVLLPLCAGATVERKSPFYPQEIAESIGRTGATVLITTPAHLRSLTAVVPASHRLRLVLSSGAPLLVADATSFAASAGIWPLEVYGSTETGGIAVRRQDVPNCPWSAMPAVECRVEDETLEVRSAFVSQTEGGDRGQFFRTADLAEIVADGRFNLMGRSDGIVKVGGQRVSLLAVENALAALEGVSDAVVLGLPSASGRGQEIVALAASSRPADEVVRELRAKLPSPSWPRRLRTAPSIPTTPSGKRDRSAILRVLDIDEGGAT